MSAVVSQIQMPRREVRSADGLCPRQEVRSADGLCALLERAFHCYHLLLPPSVSVWLRTNWFWCFIGQNFLPLIYSEDTEPILQLEICRCIRSIPPVLRSYKFQPSPSEKSPLPNLLSTDSDRFSFWYSWGFTLLYLQDLGEDPVSLFLKSLSSSSSSFTCWHRSSTSARQGGNLPLPSFSRRPQVLPALPETYRSASFHQKLNLI